MRAAVVVKLIQEVKTDFFLRAQSLVLAPGSLFWACPDAGVASPLPRLFFVPWLTPRSSQAPHTGLSHGSSCRRPKFGFSMPEMMRGPEAQLVEWLRAWKSNTWLNFSYS